jgi:hypothetical protein
LITRNRPPNTPSSPLSCNQSQSRVARDPEADQPLPARPSGDLDPAPQQGRHRAARAPRLARLPGHEGARTDIRRCVPGNNQGVGHTYVYVAPSQSGSSIPCIWNQVTYRSHLLPPHHRGQRGVYATKSLTSLRFSCVELNHSPLSSPPRPSRAARVGGRAPTSRRPHPSTR